MGEKYVRLTPQLRTNLFLSVEGTVDLLIKTSEELLQEIEQAQESSSRVKLTFRARPRWFYQERIEPQISASQSEISKVEQQVRYEFDGLDLEIALEIVSHLDHRGFFTGSVEQIARRYGVSEDYVEDIREFIMREVEPLGVASKNLEEFMLVQLKEMYPGEEALHREVLQVIKGKSRDRRAREVLSHLKLSPFEGEGAVKTGGCVDVIFEYDGSEWYLFLMEDFWDVEEAGSSKVFSFLLELRRRVLRTACELILERQAGFMLGKEPLKSLTLSQVAQRAGVNLSTVSRIISRKHAKTPAGTFPLRFFFLRESKGGLSREEILRAIREVLKSEGKDISDAQLALRLKERGINIARRTVNKYRRMLEEGP